MAMGKKRSGFSEKHGTTVKPDPAIQEAIRNGVDGNELACAVAFSISGDLGVSPADVGKNADLMELRLVKCQLGLFGYPPQKKIVKPSAQLTDALEKQIVTSAQNDQLSCETVWKIADDLGIGKMSVSGACETLGIKIKPCQLGAF
jgi:hypothetical protein